MENSLRAIRIFDLSTDAENVATFPGVILDVVVCALVCKLCHFDLFGGELFVEVEEVEAGWG